MNLQKYKTIVVLLEPGMGCSHMANLLATSPKLADRVENPDTNYANVLNNHYSRSRQNAHVFQLIAHIDNVLEPKLHGIVEHSELPYVLGGHLQSIYGRTGDTLRQLGDMLILLGVATTLNEFIQKRAGPKFLNYFFDSYQKNKVAQIGNVSPDNIVEFDPNLLFCNNVTELLISLDQTLELDLDIDFCQDIHTKWLTNITNNLRK